MVLRLPRMEHSGEESGEHITAAKGTMLPEMIDNRVQVNPAVGFCCIPLSLIQFISVSPMTKPIESSARMEGNASALPCWIYAADLWVQSAAEGGRFMQ